MLQMLHVPVRKWCERDRGDHESKLAEGDSAQQEQYGPSDEALKGVQEMRSRKGKHIGQMRELLNEQNDLGVYWI